MLGLQVGVGEISTETHCQGAFDLGGKPPEFFVDPDVAEFVVGWFNESLPAFLAREITPL
eukprot:3762359-Amphidinium_carterae.1